MNNPAHQASRLLNRLASRPVAGSMLRSTLLGLSQTSQNQSDQQPPPASAQVQSTAQSTLSTLTSSPQSLPIPQLLPSTQRLPTQQTPPASRSLPIDDRLPILSFPQTPSLADSLNDSSTSTVLPQDLVDDDVKLALFDSVLDEIAPQVSVDTPPTSVPNSQLTSLLQSQTKPNDTVVATTLETPDQVRDDDVVDQYPVRNDDAVGQHDPLVSMMSQSLPSDQFLPDTLNISPAPTSSRAPERVPPAVPTTEVPGIAYVEQEPNNLEIPVEVEGFLERVADHVDKLPQELVIQGNNIALNQAQPIKQAVIMLPISEEDEKKARGKNPTWSIAWLVSWSQKIIKKFTGQVVYSHSPTQVANS